jgi:maltooligosyltrehalose trehalohydrolase
MGYRGSDWDFFLAHAGADKGIAESLYDHLTGGCRVFLDSRCLRLGDDWDTELAAAQQRSLVTVVLVSSKTDTAYYQREEVAAAIALARENPESHRVVPIYTDTGCDNASIPYGLRLKHGITLGADCRLADAAARLLELRHSLSQAPTSAGPGSEATTAGPNTAVPDSPEAEAPWKLPFGATLDEGGTRFRVWAPACQSVDVAVFDAGTEQSPRVFPLEPEGNGYYSAWVREIAPGALYKYRLNGQRLLPDPASRSQPGGVHGASEIVDPESFEWTDHNWTGISATDLIVYETHVGTATPAGTFDGLVERLKDIRSLGVTAIQLMPIADFGGHFNWGYDGVDLFAPSHVYGGPSGLRRLVDAAHRNGLALIVDVVFNHLGPEGNYLREFSPSFFRDGVGSTYGDRPNYVGLSSLPVREFMMQNARYWVTEYHVDGLRLGLRLDAVQALANDDEPYIVKEIAEATRDAAPRRHVVVIAEDQFNQPMLVMSSIARRVEDRGYGLDAVYADDFHHQLHVLVSGERDGYYADYSGRMDDVVSTINEGWWFVGQRSAFRDRPVGEHAWKIPPERLVWCLQNHDQIGNRPAGDRLHQSLAPEVYRAASALLLLSPYTPLLFMGQEWAASTPFPFFADHEFAADAAKGRAKDLARLCGERFNPDRMPSVDDEATFRAAKLNWQERTVGSHAGTLELYRALIRIRKEHPAFRARARRTFQAAPVGDRALALVRGISGPGSDRALVIVNFRGSLSVDLRQVQLPAIPETPYMIALDTEDPLYSGRETARLSNGRLEMKVPGAVVLTFV